MTAHREPVATDDVARRQAEYLARAMDADSQRIDSLVDAVGTVKGHVQEVRSKIDGVDGKVDQLRDALAVLVRHDVQMDHQRPASEMMQGRVDRLEGRMSHLEGAIGPLQEMRTWAVRGLLLRVGTVGMAVLGLVLSKGTP
jgi:phage shock protein A